MYNSAIYPSQQYVRENSYQTSNKQQFNDQYQNQRNQMMYQRLTQTQTQTQSYQKEQLQDQAQIQYYIFEDFQNLINLLYSLQTVSEYFKNDPNNEIVTLCRNKVISQLNISNLIHYDIQQNYKDPKYQQLIKREKQKVKEIISQLPYPIQNSKYLNLYYQNSLSDQIKCKQQQLEKINIAPNFNQQVVSQIFSSMQLIDRNLGQIKQQNYYPIPTKNDILAKAEQYEILTQSKLESNFPKMQQFQSQIYGNEKQLYSTSSFERNQSWKNSPQTFQSQIIPQPKQQRYSSNQHYQYDKQKSNFIGGFKNLGNY
ncbi:unnamed protein product [Paramecium primaurelia]|uniref:Uncharacterized protein n=1 Tax=Paramecium primaurelia TaxID=5886 RepID=A0A8S1KZA1_PARPR|nr:unnamed protein product [Paramecium primaurelia]